jgi:hypothetical protein
MINYVFHHTATGWQEDGMFLFEVEHVLTETQFDDMLATVSRSLLGYPLEGGLITEEQFLASKGRPMKRTPTGFHNIPNVPSSLGDLRDT